jgi:DNA-binding NarL/FixJ family response regulator
MGYHLPQFVKLKILVAEDHEIFLEGTIDLLRRQYPDADIRAAPTVETVLEQIQQFQPDLLVLDLALPEMSGDIAQTETGLQLLRKLLQDYPNLNLTVLSTYVKALIRIRPEIDLHNGGFTIVDKSFSGQEMLRRVDWALQGLAHTRDITRGQTGLEFKPEWLTVLNLAFQESLNDWAIAERMNVSERTVRHYWTKIYDALNVYPVDGKSSRIQTEIRAREAGLID